ncbi:hypothetical protein R6Q59_033317 [Mikania micrantha]
MEDPKKLEEGDHAPVVARENPETMMVEVREDENKMITKEYDEPNGGDNPILQVKKKSKRVATLDAFRGLTIVLMILVDDAGGVYERIDHSPWNGCTLADFVMPFFLFIVGVAIALALKRVPSMKYAVRKIIIRTLKMLFWGILLQGGYSHAPDDLDYGVDIKKIRWCGILQACTLSSPESGPLRPEAPSWCRAPFEPEGLLSSISAILSGVIGIHYGHVLIHFKGHAERLKQWVSMGVGLLIIAIILHFTDAIPINKQLYSVSYVCFTAGAAGIVFSAFYILIDVWGKRTPFLLFEWIGMNAMLVFVLGAQGILAGFINGWYYENVDNNLVNWIQNHVFINVWNSEKLGTLLYGFYTNLVYIGSFKRKIGASVFLSLNSIY